VRSGEINCFPAVLYDFLILKARLCLPCSSFLPTCLAYCTFFHQRLSFVTEQVAEHTNGTIGALLNATFGNAPELLIATAALRSGFYRVVQLAMLGSILTNLLFVFGMACLIGGMRWQVQEIRVISGNVSVGMLFTSTAGSLLPAALFLSGQLPSKVLNDDVPSKEELAFCRINAAVMVFLYLCYLLFQLGTHIDEFDDNEQSADSKQQNHPAKRNLWCKHHCMRGGFSSRHFHMEVATNDNTQNTRPVPERKIEKYHDSDHTFHDEDNGNGLMNGMDGTPLDGSVSSRSTVSDTDYDADLYGGESNSAKQRRRRRRRHKKRDVEDSGSAGIDPLEDTSDKGMYRLCSICAASQTSTRCIHKSL